MWEPVTDESSVASQQQQQQQQQAQPAALCPEEEGRLQAALKPELRKLSRWLIAKKGWQEDHDGLLLPAGQAAGAGAGLNAAGLYEHTRTRLWLFKEYIDDPEREAVVAAASKPKPPAAAAAASGSAAPAKGNSGGSGTKAAAAASAAAAAAPPAPTTAKTARAAKAPASTPRGKTGKAAAPAAAAPAPAAAAARARAPSPRRQPQQPPQPAVADLSTMLPSHLGVRLEEAGDDAALLQYFATTSGAWSGLFRRLLEVEKRLTAKGCVDVGLCLNRDIISSLA